MSIGSDGASEEGRNSPVDPLEEAVDHMRGSAGVGVILEYGDYECPYSRLAFHQIERVEEKLDGRVRFVYRYFPLVDTHPHAFAAATAAEAAALQGRFWEMHNLLYRRQKALADNDLRTYAGELGLDIERFDRDREASGVLARVRRDMESGIASGEVRGTPTLFINGVVYRGDNDAETLVETLTR
jgi:protein-disulfide isomerase